MMPAVDAGMRSFAIRGRRGRLAAIYYGTAPGVAARGDVLYCPPFGEEMNRCRAMVSMQARALAARGIGTLVVDPHGTGDSAGEHVEASWAQWRDDLEQGLAWIRRSGRPCLATWGVRLGALMAAEVALADGGIPNLLLWQPVLNGKQFLTQFLRIRIAADLERAGGVKSTDELRREFEAGRPVEVSGYEVSAELGRALDGLAFPPAQALAGRVAVCWFEVLAGAESPVPRASLTCVDNLRAAGATVDFRSVIGPPFWQVHERELAPALIEATSDAGRGWSAAGQASPPGVDAGLEDDAPVEEPLLFACGDDVLAGILHRAAVAPRRERGVVIVVAGGPQYRAGAHRQFVSLARKLASRGYPVLRFDLRGMGDSSGVHRGFQQSGPDIQAAVDALLAREPGLREVVLFGECESASGILFYGWRDPRVAGLALVNPWVRTEEGQAQVIVKHYYLDRLRSREFWDKLRSGKFNARESLASLVDVLRKYVRARRMHRAGRGAGDDMDGLPLPQKTAAGLSRFQGRVLLLMSGRDYIAREFDEVTASARAWQGLLDDRRVTRLDIEDADHTFSRAEWKAAASGAVLDWLERD
jgi:exosortase A-associated hydrolase 1/exosortase A-associated hydrolase 2